MKIVLLEDLNGNEFQVNPNEIVSVVETESNRIVKMINTEVVVRNAKHMIENVIKNCYLP